MWTKLRPVRTIAPVNRIVSVADAKAHLRVDYDDDDSLIERLIEAVESHLDGYAGILGRALISQTWQEQFPYFRYDMPLRLGPVQSVTSVSYYDNDEALQTASADTYRLHETASRAYLQQRDGQSWPSTYTRDDAVTITYVAGYGDDASDVPAGIVQAALLLVSHWYENREGVAAGISMADVPMAVDALLTPYRRVG